MKNSKLIVLSADALVSDDMELFKTLPNFKKYLSGGAVLHRCDTVDEAPTFAHILGTEIKDADGRVLTELLK